MAWLYKTFSGMGKRAFSSSSTAASSMSEPNYELSAQPDWTWASIKAGQTFLDVPMVNPSTPKPANHTRFVCISDTHTLTDKLVVPDGDVLIHAGDFSNVGLPRDVELFNLFLGSLPHKHKVVIAGNHDISFDENGYAELWKRFRHDEMYDCKAIKQMLTNCIYLEDSETTVLGYRIYGSPWQPEFCEWGFNLFRGKDLDDTWAKIPSGVDILITHGPPLGRGDLTTSEERAGCFDLLRHVQQRVKPALHVFGHIHEGYGVSSDGVTTYVNASTCTSSYRPVQPAIVIDLPNRVAVSAADDD